MQISAIARTSGSISSTRNFVPVSERLADDPKTGCPLFKLKRLISAWNGPEFINIATVPDLVLRS